MNCYATVDDLKLLAPLASEADAYLLWLAEASSRAVDQFCGRHFYTVQESRYFDSLALYELLLDDVLSISELVTDSEADGTFDGETWTEGNAGDYILEPVNDWPKTRLRVLSWGDYGLAAAAYYLKITGVWGYGDGESASPFETAGCNVTLADGTTTTATLSAANGLLVGHTARVEDEDIFVSAIDESGVSATVERGVNGTDGMAHTAKAASIARYPASVKRTGMALAAQMHSLDGVSGFESKRIGDYSYKVARDPQSLMLQTLGALRRVRVG